MLRYVANQNPPDVQSMLVSASLLPHDDYHILSMICGAVGLETQDRIRFPRFVVFLGDASYAIYLAHLTVLSVVALTLKAVGLAVLPSIALATIVFLAAVLVGSLLHVLIEKPIIAFFRKKRPQAWAAK